MAKVLSALLIAPSGISQITPQLRNWAYRFSPLFELDHPPGDEEEERADPRYTGINWDIEGCERLFKGELPLLRRIKQELTGFGIRSRLAIAPTLGCAWAVSRYGPADLITVHKHEIKDALSLLPAAALRLPPPLQAALKEVNITRIEHLFNIPRKALAARFGKELLDRLDQALGDLEEPLLPARMKTVPAAQQLFEHPTTAQETFLHTAEALLEQLAEKCAAAGQSISRLLVEIQAIGAAPCEIELCISVPSTRKTHLWSLLRPRLEQIQMGFGIELVRLSARRTECIHPFATALPEMELRDDGATTLAFDQNFGELLDTLTSHLGAGNVLRLQCRESHIPERAFAYSAAAVNQEQHPPPLVETERPSLLFYAPQPIEAMSLLPDSPPFRLKWRGKLYQLVTGIGPERITPEWWGKDSSLYQTRDYFKVQLPSGIWLWIFRFKENNQWFLHGVWA